MHASNCVSMIRCLIDLIPRHDQIDICTTRHAQWHVVMEVHRRNGGFISFLSERSHSYTLTFTNARTRTHVLLLKEHLTD